jgi:hypothetical protein
VVLEPLKDEKTSADAPYDAYPICPTFNTGRRTKRQMINPYLLKESRGGIPGTETLG